LRSLVEVPDGWENCGNLYANFDGLNLKVEFGDEAGSPAVAVQFGWVRSFRYISEATYEPERNSVKSTSPLVVERPLPDARNPSNDYYGDILGGKKRPPRLFRVFHYKAGLFEVVASDCRVD